MSRIFVWLTDHFGFVDVTMWAISFVSTIVERAFLFLVCAIVLATSFVVVRSLRSRLAQVLLPVATAFALFVSLYTIFPFTAYPFPVDGYLFPGDHPFIVAAVLALIVAAIAGWFGRRVRGGKPKSIAQWLPAVVVASGVAVLLLNGWALRGMSRALHPDSAVSQFAKGDFNWIELDASTGSLYASGHGTDYLLAYDVNALEQPPRRSAVEIGGAQAFAYNPEDRELYVLNEKTRTVLFLDATTLALKGTVPDVEIALADVFLAWDRNTRHILIAAEESDDGHPTVVIDRPTATVVANLDLSTYNLYQDPYRPRVYMAADGESNLVAYDMALQKVVAGVKTPSQFLERMALTPDRTELLVAVPLMSAVFRHNSETLAPKGRIDTVFGVRALAVDPVRNLLLTGSLISNMIEVLDLKTETSVAKYHVGPWLRTIAIDSRAGVAYVSSIEGLFRVQYSTAAIGTYSKPTIKEARQKKFAIAKGGADHAVDVSSLGS